MTKEIKDYSTIFTVDKSPEEVYNAINNVRGWWLQNIDGSTVQLNDEFKYYEDGRLEFHFKIIEMIPNKKIVWLVLDQNFDGTEKKEWKDSTVVFEITQKNGQTQVTFTHAGLVPELECYGGCSFAWGNYIHQSLMNLIATGKGMPDMW